MGINYGYIRVSTVNQSTDVQRYEIAKYCDLHNIKIDKWVDETISGTKKIQNRKLKYIVDHAKKGDCIICTEISRLGRSMQIISEIMSFCVEHGVSIYTLKENYSLNDNNPTTKLILQIYGYAAETERNLISERTKEGLAALKREGKKLGRPCGSKSKKLKLDQSRDRLIMILANEKPKTQIAKILKVNTSTIYDYMKIRNIESDVKEYQKIGMPKKWHKYNN